MRREVSLKKEIRLKCYDALEREGFLRFAKEGVDFPLNDVFHCWVGLNTGVYSDLVEINPFIGVHAVPVEKLAASIKGRKYDRGIATYAIPMGELESVQNERAFSFTPDQSSVFLEKEAHRLAKLYAKSGISFSRSIASYNELLPLLKDRLDMLGGYPESVACCLYLMGKKDEALMFVEDFLSKEPAYFGSFAEPFLRRIEDVESDRSHLI